jgi:hypothetical protein
MEDLAQYEANGHSSFKYKDLNIYRWHHQAVEEYVLHKYLKWLHLMI